MSYFWIGGLLLVVVLLGLWAWLSWRARCQTGAAGLQRGGGRGRGRGRSTGVARLYEGKVRLGILGVVFLGVGVLCGCGGGVVSADVESVGVLLDEGGEERVWVSVREVVSGETGREWRQLVVEFPLGVEEVWLNEVDGRLQAVTPWPVEQLETGY